MNKTDLIKKVMEKADLQKKDADNAVTAVVDSIIEAVAAGEKVQIVGFGTFEQRLRKERTGVNPRSHEKLTIPASKVPAFKPGKAFKEIVDGNSVDENETEE